MGAYHCLKFWYGFAISWTNQDGIYQQKIYIMLNQWSWAADGVTLIMVGLGWYFRESDLWKLVRSCNQLEQFAMPDTSEYWFSLVTNYVYYTHYTCEIYQKLPYSVDCKATGKLK